MIFGAVVTSAPPPAAAAFAAAFGAPAPEIRLEPLHNPNPSPNFNPTPSPNPNPNPNPSPTPNQVDTPFYAELRTKQQLGYIVGSSITESEGAPPPPPAT